MSAKSYPLNNISIGIFLYALTYNVIFCKMFFANTLEGFEFTSSRNIFLPFFGTMNIDGFPPPLAACSLSHFGTQQHFGIALSPTTHNQNITFDKKHASLVRMFRQVIQLSTLRPSRFNLGGYLEKHKSASKRETSLQYPHRRRL